MILNPDKEMCKVASELGADGIIDIHRGPGCQWKVDAGVPYNGLLVKWLPLDATPKKLEKTFLVSRLPIIKGSNRQ